MRRTLPTRTITLFLLCLGLLQTACREEVGTPAQEATKKTDSQGEPEKNVPPEVPQTLQGKLVQAALLQTTIKVTYDPAYVRLAYPGGDVPENRGVCADVIIRAFRKIGIDLQKEVHEDMAAHFSLYPKKWGLAKPDSNIDHRRVPNLMTFFGRHGKSLPISNLGTDYAPGNIVAWDLGGGLTHIGLVTDRLSEDKTRPLVVHNIGAGPKLEDVLFSYKIIGHYRYALP